MAIDVIHAAVMVVFYAISLTGVIVVVWGAAEAIVRFFALKCETLRRKAIAPDPCVM